MVQFVYCVVGGNYVCFSFGGGEVVLFRFEGERKEKEKLMCPSHSTPSYPASAQR